MGTVIEPRIAIVTGASRGIGRAIALRLAADGRVVVLVSRSADTLEEVRREIEEAGGAAEARPCDIADSDALAGLVEDVANTHGRLDILVNNAGITRDGLLLRMSDEDFDTVIQVNLRSAFVACRAAARPMMRGRFGRIINISSVTGIVGNPGQANYAAAKAGLIGLTKSLAKELGSKGITANVVAPGFVETSMVEAMTPQLREQVTRALPVRRFGQPEEIAHAVSFIASDLSGYLTGQVLIIDGGMVC
ncbi:MAG: 3-oxoacyl-[acyl-carrier-protein] reductase [Planctomycetota bacterium]|nr:3-oxoacyl-[acyl-carrier-protein] reductase [Planctomycetota bacterium]